MTSRRVALALEAQAEPRNLRFERLGLEQGLSQGHVACILQDRHGCLWLRPQDGQTR